MLKTKFTTLTRDFAADESGAAAIEYAIMAALVAMAIIAAVTNIGTALTGVFNNISNKLV